MTLGDRTVTVGYTDTTSATGADGGTALKTFLQDQFRAAFADIEGAENIAVTFEGTNAFKLVNTTTESGSFKISGTSGATNIDVTTGITAATITGTSVNFDYTNATTADITTGVKGSVAVTGVGTFDIDLPQGSTGVDLAAAVQTGLKDLGVNANVEILGGNLKITNFERSAVEIDFSAVTDGTNQVFVNKDVAGATIESLSDYLGKGNTATFTAEINGEGFEIKDARSLTDVVNGINQRSGETGVKASLSANGQDIFFSSERGTDFDAKLDVKVASVEINRDIAATAEDNTVLADQFSVATLEDANRTLLVADYALDQVNSLRGELGAIQNRFEAAISNLRVGSENLSAANSRIRDADFAAETAELTRAQILQQAGTTVLAQANQIPNSVLALLQ
ncbi:flagellin [Ectothiorhodospira shaposhnikovii]|uniref:flagellin n=1 Tax=Ectothiorhodospira shaposhnikovii TaxID=1054 RepID=UPI001904D04A